MIVERSPARVQDHPTCLGYGSSSSLSKHHRNHGAGREESTQDHSSWLTPSPKRYRRSGVS